MGKNVKKIFLFSLPRSGSTLVQRILTAHSKISSVSEPWLLLPFIYANKSGNISEYSHNATANGINDMISKLPNGIEDYQFHLKNFFDNIYNLLADENTVYFLDKTPRYSRIITEISNLYPNAKFLFLLRNPVQVFGSMLSMFGYPTFRMLGHDRFYQDLYEGPKFLADGYELLKDKAYAFQYEQFIGNPEKYLKEICNYLELAPEDRMLKYFHENKLEGIYGDNSGLKNYNNTISREPLEKWKVVFNSAFRKKILLDYISALDDKALSTFGYDKNSMIEEVSALKTNGSYNLVRDFYDIKKIKFKNKFNRLSFD